MKLVASKCGSIFRGLWRTIHRKGGKGSINIAVSDKMCPWNDGVWKLSYSSGRPNEVALTDEAADIELDINMFTSLILGITTAEDIPYMLSAKLNNADAPLGDVFYKKLCFCPNLF